jgi:hypothetical protein
MVYARRADVRAKAIDDQQSQRKEDALTQVWNLKHVTNSGEKLFHTGTLFQRVKLSLKKIQKVSMQQATCRRQKSRRQPEAKKCRRLLSRMLLL